MNDLYQALCPLQHHKTFYRKPDKAKVENGKAAEMLLYSRERELQRESNPKKDTYWRLRRNKNKQSDLKVLPLSQKEKGVNMKTTFENFSAN